MGTFAPTLTHAAALAAAAATMDTGLPVTPGPMLLAACRPPVTHTHMEWRNLTQERVRREADKKTGLLCSGEGHDQINVQTSNLFTCICPFLSSYPSVLPHLLLPRSPRYFPSLPLFYSQAFRGKSWGIPKCPSLTSHNVSLLWAATPLSMKMTDP